MLTTSVSLPAELAPIWRSRQRQVMRMAIRMLRLTMYRHGVRRGVKRRYNRQPGEFLVVTTRFTEAEYDTLHCAAAAMRVSVSWLVFQMILLWQKPSRRLLGNRYVTNYDCDVTKWCPNAGILTESLLFWRKPYADPPSPAKIP